MGDFGIVPPVPYTRIFPDKPLGDLQKNDFKFLAAPELLEQAKDKAQLVKVTNAVNQHGQKNNASKKRSQTRCRIFEPPRHTHDPRRTFQPPFTFGQDLELTILNSAITPTLFHHYSAAGSFAGSQKHKRLSIPLLRLDLKMSTKPDAKPFPFPATCVTNPFAKNWSSRPCLNSAVWTSSCAMPAVSKAMIRFSTSARINLIGR